MITKQVVFLKDGINRNFQATIPVIKYYKRHTKIQKDSMLLICRCTGTTWREMDKEEI